MRAFIPFAVPVLFPRSGVRKKIKNINICLLCVLGAWMNIVLFSKFLCLLPKLYNFKTFNRKILIWTL